MKSNRFHLWLKIFLLSLWPSWAAADNSLSFTPPLQDLSVLFLSNIFGVVDGVLHGSGSQIMGNMFSVFNAAVLALGGIVIMYTLIVGTMNTAHEGEMLGHKWSSIWIPLRATIGLALLIPKASGYCLIQIFVMWIVVQGVGAADKVWNVALSYLNRGGVIVHFQINPQTSMAADTKKIAQGASRILAGEVCMMALQKQLENQQKVYRNAKDKYNAGPCTGEPTGAIATICNDTIPNFVNSVNVVYAQSQNPGATNYSVPMPNFEPSSHFASLNGICGKIAWSGLGYSQTQYTTLSSEEWSTMLLSRAIGIQQMYMDLSLVAQAMVNNDPQLTASTNTNNFSPVAMSQFGIPYMSTGAPCATGGTPLCRRWGTDLSSTTGAVLTGTEFQGAVTDYNAIMLPTLRYHSQMVQKDKTMQARKFIADAQDNGWALAGSYFFDLVQLNGMDVTSESLTDSSSGLDSSVFDISTLLGAFNDTSSCGAPYTDLCMMMMRDPTRVKQIAQLIDGRDMLAQPLSLPDDLTPNNTANQVQLGAASSTVYGYIVNSSILQLVTQETWSPKFGQMGSSPKVHALLLKFPELHFCGGTFIIKCFLGRLIGYMYNDLIIRFINEFIKQLTNLYEAFFIQQFLMIPLVMISKVFTEAVQSLANTGANPIIALAKLGGYFVDQAMNVWITMLGMGTIFGWISGFGVVMSLIEPFLYSWLTVMVTVGYTMAFYVPFMPYMIFTFGVIAWFMAVIEAMAAAPIVALGITHPEGEGILGKGEQAIMILMNVFLRPSMMIIGYVAAISLSYVCVWLLNAGYAHVLNSFMSKPIQEAMSVGVWTNFYATFFSVLIYASIYLTIVQKSFTLIYVLPDKVLRWVAGGQAEQVGAEVAQWTEETKGQIKEAATETAKAGAVMTSKATGYAEQAAGEVSKRLGKGANIEGGGE